MRAALGSFLAGALLLGLGAFGAPAAQAAPPAITFALAAVATESGAAVSEVEAGQEFRLEASVGCPDPSGCGPAMLTVQFPDRLEFLAEGFVGPTGATVTTDPPDTGAGRTVTLEWEQLTDTAVVFLPARAVAALDASLNGTQQTVTAELSAGADADLTTIAAHATVDLRVFAHPGVDASALSWADGAVADGSGAETKSTITATATANATSSLQIQVPSAEALPAGSLAAAEAFDLGSLTLNRNPGGAQLSFVLADQNVIEHSLAPGELTAVVPDTTIGYTVTLQGLPSLSTGSEKERTLEVVASATLRDTTRSDGSRIIDPAANSRQVRATAEVMNTVSDPAPGAPATATARTHGIISVNALAPAVEQDLTWQTASGDTTSVYRSGEAATATVRLANSGVPSLAEASIELSTATSQYFEFQRLTDVPAVRFPAGAATATIEYRYASAPLAGARHEFAPGDPVPGPGSDGREVEGETEPRTLAEVSGITVVFRAADGGEISGGCALAEECAAQLELVSVLRHTQLSSGAAIAPPAGNPGTTRVDAIATIAATATTGARFQTLTQRAWISLVKPQVDVTLSKRLGDGSHDVVYPLTGIAQAGDIFRPGVTPQSFADHPLRFVATTKAVEDATEWAGAETLTVVDPQLTPTVAGLDRNPFNTIRVTALPTGDAAQAVCITADGSPVESETTQQFWVLDRTEDPQRIELMPADHEIDLELIVGLETTVNPTDATGRFPAGVSCETAPGTTVSFRDTRISDGEPVSPATIGAPETPGLLAVGNTAELRTGQNTATTTGSDSLYLVDQQRMSLSKTYEAGARGYGIQGQESPTAFLLSGVPASTDTVATRIIDGDTKGAALDVFALAAVRDARLGPDQQMTVSFRDLDGAEIGPVGRVEASTQLASRELSEAEIENSQSAGYLEFQRTERAIAWSGTWADGERARVFTVRIDVTRADPDQPLQRYGAFSVVLETTLRAELLSAPGTAVTGTPSGQVYLNTAEVSSRNAGESWGPGSRTSAEYTVYAVAQLIGDARVTWTTPDGDHFLVAKHGTESRITLDAGNKTAVGVAGVAPENQWSASGSVPVGLDRVSIGVGSDPTDAANPFAITDFAGVTAALWPEREGAVPGERETERRVAGTITYRFSDGGEQTVAAPVGAKPADLNPARSRWPDVVGVTASWAEAGKRVGVARAQNERQGRLVFATTLRDQVRAGGSYTFVEGDPITLAGAQEINGAQDTGGTTVHQIAAVTADFRGELAGVAPVTQPRPQSARLPIVAPVSTVAVSLAVTQRPEVFRDAGVGGALDTRWRLTTQNTGNIPVSALRLATESDLLAGEWSAPQQSSGAPAPGSVLDAANITRVSLAYPTGATTALVWVRGEDGGWTPPITAPNNAALTLPNTGAGPRSWAAATGLRVQFSGPEGAAQQIAKRATGALLVDTQLRETLRSDSGQRAPATDLPDGQTLWRLTMTGAGASYVESFAEQLTNMRDVSATMTVNPGAPAPLVKKYAAKYDSDTNTGATSTLGNAGAWVNFTVVLENQKSATSSLYGLTAVDTLPAELSYNAANPAQGWQVIRAPEGISKLPNMQLTPGPEATMRWTWPADQGLKPGERIVIRVPLQLNDGVPAGAIGRNTARLVGTGIAGAPTASVCQEEDASSSACVATASATTQRSHSMRVESLLDASVRGGTTLAGESCDATTVMDWEDGTWVRNPCITDTTATGLLRYRVKLINSGNVALADVRFVDELPAVGDQGAVLNSPRGSAWTPQLVPDTVRLLTGAEATALGARGDGVLVGDAFRYSATAKPCLLDPDGYAGTNTLACAGGSWSAEATKSTRSIGGDITFDPAAQLAGGEYIIVEFAMRVPATSEEAQLSWNSAAVSGREAPISTWFPVSESPRSGARTADTSMTVTHALADGPATPWHLGAASTELVLSCLSPGATEPRERRLELPGISTLTGTQSATVTGLPRGAACAVIDEVYVPRGTTGSGHYGAASDGVTGFGFRTDPVAPRILGDDGSANRIGVVTEFTPAEVALGVDVAGTAAALLPADAEFAVEMRCDFGGITEDFGAFRLADGDTTTVSGLPVGANCAASETDHRGAATVTATVDGADAVLDAERAVTLAALEPGAHTARFLNTFDAGGALTVRKTVEVPRAGTAVGDVAFEVSCQLGGYPLDLGDQSRLGLSFAPGASAASGSIPGLPAGAECTVHESEAGGASVAAPDRTVTILPRDEVIVDMVNTFHPAALELEKRVAGPGAAEARVPGSFDVRASCSRELVIAGEARTVTDYDAVTSLSPDTPAVIPDLPAGTSCAVSEPDTAGAARTTVAVADAALRDEDPSEDAVLVALRGPDVDGTARPTPVRITNEYAQTGGPGTTPGGGLSVTGGNATPLTWGAVILLLLGASALLLRRRAATGTRDAAAGHDGTAELGADGDLGGAGERGTDEFGADEFGPDGLGPDGLGGDSDWPGDRR